MHQRRQSIHAKRTTSIRSRTSGSQRQKGSLRRTWSTDLPSLANHTVKLLAATLQIDSKMPSADGANHSEREQSPSDDVDDDDDEHDDILNIGQDTPAHIPDIVLNNLNELIDRKGQTSIPNKHIYENSTLLFLDVSGFTCLTEKYQNEAHFGVDQLIRTLNSYFNKLVYEILTHKGDIYKFAGDAILALWPNDEQGPQHALKCALHLQQKCGSYPTDIGVTLYIKVALAYGSVRALYVGTDEFKHYLLTGDCIKEVNNCEHLCKPEDIILTKTIYEKVQEEDFHCEFVPVDEELDPQQEHMLVKYSRSRLSSFGDDYGPEDHVDSETFVDKRMEKTNQEITNDSTPADKQQQSEDDLPAEELQQKVEALMKSFVLRSVRQRIERNQSLNYLSELRHVTVEFINLDIDEDESITENISQLIHEVFLIVHESTEMMGGVLNKALLFDKGWSFLCVFGLPGYMQGDDTANALKSAQMIRSAILNQCKYVRKCSIGVTTGLTYCGVLGHKARCEYTVIGGKVNMAARLMCNYPNVISCDNETYHNSRLNGRCFQALPQKALKGLNNVGIVWHYDDCYHDTCQTDVTDASEINRDVNDIRQETYPLLGRRVELMIVAAQIMLLDEPTSSSNRQRNLAAIVFEGDDKIGRTRLLQFIADSLKNSTNSSHISSISHYNNTYVPVETAFNGNQTLLPTSDNDDQPASSLNVYSIDCTMIKKSSIRVVNYRCQFEQRFNEFGLLRFLLRELFQFHKGEENQYEREQSILELFDINQTHDLYLRRNLFLLNDLLDTRFKGSHLENENFNEKNLSKAYETNINELIVHILNKLIDQPDNIGALYNPAPIADMTNKHASLYSQSCLFHGSETNYNSPSALATTSKLLFIIDDIHFADGSSLNHLLTFGSHPKCLLILSMKPPQSNNNYDRSNSDILQSISTDSRVYLRRLPRLELRYLATLGCQILSVHRLPSKLVQVFNDNCDGIPGFCEQILFDLMSKEKLSIVENDNSHDDDEDLVDGDADKLISSSTIKDGLFKTCFSRRKQSISADLRENERAFSRICLLKNSANDDFSADCRRNFQNYIMCRIDRLSSGESDLLKIAAVIGSTFSRAFLWHLVEPGSRKTLNMQSCIMEMMQRSVIECAYSQQQETKTRSIKCYCLQNPAGFPSQCRLMTFTHPGIREGVYNSFTDGFRRLLTRNAIDYLEKHCLIACSTCRDSKYDHPFLVHDQSNLAVMIKSRQQHAFVDIVKIAALKEIDNKIKQFRRASNSPVQERSNGTKVLEPSTSIPGTHRTEKTPVDDGVFRRGFSLITVPEMLNEETPEEVNDEETFDNKESEEDQPNFRDRSLTLISLYGPNSTANIQYNVQRSTSTSTPLKSSQLFPLFRVPRHTQSESAVPDADMLQTVDGAVTNEQPKEVKPMVANPKKRQDFVPVGSSATVSPIEEASPADENPSSPSSPHPPLPASSTSVPNIQSDDAPPRQGSLWKKVRKAVLPSQGKVLRAMPNEKELSEQPMFSTELMEKFSQDLQSLYKQCSQTRTFQVLYEQSLFFSLFESHVLHNNLIQYIYNTKQNPPSEPDLNEFVNDHTAFYDLRICECADYTMSVYIKLVEYHTSSYEIFEKTADERHDYFCLKQFDRIMHYRIAICELLLRCHCYQRLLVEIDHGRKLLEKLQKDIRNQEDFLYQYQSLIAKYTYNFFQARFLQHSRAINESKDLCEQCLKELHQAYEDKIWEKLISDPDAISLAEKKQDEVKKDNEANEGSTESNPPSTTITDIDQFVLSDGKHRLEFLLCQYHLLRYNLTRHESIESVDKLLELEYHTFPLSFSLACTVQLVEHFYCQLDYSQCLSLIDKLIQFWWAFTDARQRLEFAKLKCLSLIIELKVGSLDAAITSGYFAKRLLSGYHENTFLIVSSIHLTLALIAEMRVSNAELILQHLEYLSEQTMNCYAKLWCYILTLDMALELGYEILPITTELLNNIGKYRKKLHAKSYETCLLLVYSDSVLAQIYARLGVLESSKVHFHLALHQIKYDQMFISHVDLCFKRAVTKLMEVQLLHWFHTQEDAEKTTIDHFLFSQFTEEDFFAWNKTRFFIYRAYYDRLINDYHRQANVTVNNDLKWEACLQEAEKHAIKLDLEWIKRLRKSWSRPVTEQFSMRAKSLATAESPRRSMVVPKRNRRFIRLSAPHFQLPITQEAPAEEVTDEQSRQITMDEYSQQKFISWRLFHNNQNISQFHLYILPVRV